MKMRSIFNIGEIGRFTRLAVFSLVLASISYVSGQVNSGRISGTVTDSAGAAIPNASVTVKDPATSFSRTVTTDDSGFYTVTNIPVGTYSVLVEMANFKKSLKGGNAISSDSRLTVDVKLDAGQISEMVEIRKLFHIGEKKSLRFQGDIFNAFNRNNFSGIQTVVTNAGFGTFTTSGPGRSMQLGVKFGF